MKKFLGMPINVIMRQFNDMVSTKENKMGEVSIDDVNELWDNVSMFGLGTKEQANMFDYNYNYPGFIELRHVEKKLIGDVIIYKAYEIDGKIYKTRFHSHDHRNDSADWYMFNQGAYGADMSEITSITFDALPVTDHLVNINHMIYDNNRNMVKLTKVDLSLLAPQNIVNMYDFCHKCPALEIVDLRGWNGNNLQNLEGAFYGCPNLKHVYVTKELWNVPDTCNKTNLFGGETPINDFTYV